MKIESHINKKRLFSISIFIKLLAVFFITVFPIFVINVLVNIWGSEIIKDEISNNVAYQMNTYIENFENEILRIIIMQNLYLEDSDFRYAALNSSSPVQKSELIKSYISLQDKLISLKNVSAFIERATMHKIGTDFLIDSNEEYYPPEKIRNLMKIQSGNPFTYHNDKLYLIAKGGMYSNPYSLVIELSDEYIREFMLGLNQYDYGCTMLVDYTRNWSVLNNPGGDEYNNLAEEITEQYRNEDIQKSTEKRIIDTSKGRYMTYSVKSSYLNTVMLVGIPEEEILIRYHRYWNWLWIMIGLVIFMSAVFALSIFRMIKKPLIKFISAFKKIEDSNYEVKINSSRNDEFNYLYNQFNNMVGNFKKSLESEYEQRIIAEKAEYKQLMYQINPHFLHNSIGAIYRMAQNQDYENIQKLTNHLGNFYKYTTYSTLADITLVREVQHAKNYADIQDMRFSNRIKTEFAEIPKSIMNVLVPRLIIQPIIENAYKHGLRNKMSEGIVKVSFKIENNYLSIFIDDNGGETDEEIIPVIDNILNSHENDMEFSGMINVDRRLKYRYGKGSGLFSSKSRLMGLRVEIRIRIEENNKNA